MDSLRWEPERGSRLLVLDRESGDLVASVAAGSRYCLHFINSFEQEDRLNVDLLEFDAPIYSQYQPVPDFFTTVPRGGPIRFVIDLRTRQLSEQVAINGLQAPDFPAIDPRHTMQPYNDFWTLGISAAGSFGRKFFDQLVHSSWTGLRTCETYQCPTKRYLGGEPVFVGEPGSANGTVICQEFDAYDRKSYFVLFDSQNVSAGPIARLKLKSQLYLGFHAVFLPEPSVL